MGQDSNLGADFELELRSFRRVSSMGGLGRLCAPEWAQVAPLSPPRPLPPLPPPPLGVHHRLLPRVQPRVFGVQVSCLLAEHLGRLAGQQQGRSCCVGRRGARPGVACVCAAGPLCERVHSPFPSHPPCGLAPALVRLAGCPGPFQKVWNARVRLAASHAPVCCVCVGSPPLGARFCGGGVEEPSSPCSRHLDSCLPVEVSQPQLVRFVWSVVI